jgi:hypothetical protein
MTYSRSQAPSPASGSAGVVAAGARRCVVRFCLSAADVGDVVALAQHPISGRQLAHDLLGVCLFLGAMLSSSLPAHIMAAIL